MDGCVDWHLWVYVKGEGVLLTIRRDEELMALIREAWDDFQQYLDGDTPPPLMEADSAQRDDPAWANAAKTYLETKQATEAADRRWTQPGKRWRSCHDTRARLGPGSAW